MAETVVKDAAEAKKQNQTGKKQYSKANLMPEQIFDQIPYK